MLISGEMPTWRRYMHTFGFGFMCLWFIGLAAMSVSFIIGGANRGLLIVSIVFLAFALVAVGGLYRFRRAQIGEFSYDGAILQFRTLGRPEIEALPVLEIADVNGWSGRGGSMGDRLILHDGRKLYLESSVSNSSELAGEILARIRPRP